MNNLIGHKLNNTMNKTRDVVKFETAAASIKQVKRNSGRPDDILRKKSYESLNISCSAAEEERSDQSPPKKMFILQHLTKRESF